MQKPAYFETSNKQKQKNYKEVSTKRLKYCFKKRQIINSDISNLSNQFNDQRYFSTPKTYVNVSPLTNASNLLTKSQMKQQNNQENNKK